MDDIIYKNIKEYNPNKKRKILTIFDNVIADMLNNKKLNPLVTELFRRGRKLIISLVFITQSYFATPRNIRLNSMHYFLRKNPNKQELQQIILTFKTLWISAKKCTAKPYSFLVIDATFASDNLLPFWKILL